MSAPPCTDDGVRVPYAPLGPLPGALKAERLTVQDGCLVVFTANGVFRWNANESRWESPAMAMTREANRAKRATR